MVRGATARVIQANLPRHRLIKLYDDHADEFAALGYDTLADLQQALKLIKQRGSACVFGEVTANVNAVAAPIRNPSRAIEGTITLTAPAELLSGDVMEKAEERVRFGARLVSRHLDVESSHVA